MSQVLPFIWKKELGWAHKLGWKESLEISRAGQKVLARLTESQIWHQPASCLALYGKRENGLCLPFFLPALALRPDISVSPCMPVVPFKVLPLWWSSEGVNLSR